jgi:UDP-N-acetylmuramate--alanine ligase
MGIDDYAHNPSKIRAVLAAARSRYPDREIWAVWQPHTYSRTQTFLDQYAESFHNADHILVSEIYAAREQPVPGINGAMTAQAIHHADARFVPTFQAALDMLVQEVHAPAVILLMSAGDGNQIGRDYLNSTVKISTT